MRFIVLSPCRRNLSSVSDRANKAKVWTIARAEPTNLTEESGFKNLQDTTRIRRRCLNAAKRNHQLSMEDRGFPDTKWATKKVTNFLLSLTSCLGNPCLPPFMNHNASGLKIVVYPPDIYGRVGWECAWRKSRRPPLTRVNMKAWMCIVQPSAAMLDDVDESIAAAYFITKKRLN